MREREFRWTIFLMIVMGVAFSLELTAAADPADDETWQIFRLSGQRIGYGRTTEHTIEEEGRTLLVTESVQKMTIRRFGQQLDMEVQQTFVETETGELVRFSYIMDNPPNSHLETTGVVEGDEIHISTTILDGVADSSLSGMEGVHSPIALDRSLEDDPLQVGQTRTNVYSFPNSTRPSS